MIAIVQVMVYTPQQPSFPGRLCWYRWRRRQFW